MCGICGKLLFDSQAGVPPELVKSMADAMVHRGPDDAGYYVCENAGLGFRRLAIIDLAGGHQPLSNEDQTVWIVFNGEIYNYRELRKDLVNRGHLFRTHSDTEVIVHLYEELGERCVEKLRGMFGFAIWDRRHRSLLLARDRVGIKPLYYALSSTGIVFASEIKAILADPAIRAEVDPAIIDRFLTYYYVPGQQTLFRGIQKLEPGTTLTVREGNCRKRKYWDLDFTPARIRQKQAEEQLAGILEECAGLHMIADVPVGFLLSGGVDSTAMLGFAADKTDQRLSSYTIGFADACVTDERPYARIAARRYGSEHHETTISARQFADFLPGYVAHMEEPVCEPPAIALYYISRVAKDFVKVLISGEGGDEAFAGYSNYRNLVWVERAKRIAGPFAGRLSALARFSGSAKIKKYAAHFSSRPESYYYSRTSSPFHFFNAAADRFYTREFAGRVRKDDSAAVTRRLHASAAEYDSLSRMLYVDTKTWLPDDLLIKADKMTMANSIELRVPLLDHKVLEFAAGLPSNFKVRGLTTKYIAKKTLRQRVPREILERKKAGFPVPYDGWLRHELRDSVREVLLDSKTLCRGYFQRAAIESLLESNDQTGGYPKEVFSLVVLELWHREFIDRRAPAAGPSPQTAIEAAFQHV